MQLPDGFSTPAFIQLLQWIADPVVYLEAAAQRFGDIFTARWGGLPPFILISNPQALQEMLSADAKLFDSGAGNTILLPLVGENSILLLDGDRHMRQRKLLIPAFHGDRMRSYGNTISDIALSVVSQVNVNEPFGVRKVMQEITMRVIMGTVFGISDHAAANGSDHSSAKTSRYQALKQLLSAMLDSLSSPLQASVLFLPILQKDWGKWTPWGKYRAQQQQIDRLIYDEIQERRTELQTGAAVSRTDVLSLLISAQDEAGESMTDVELRDELITLLIAGHETTASALAWAFYWVHHLPEVYDKLMYEIRSLGANPDPMAIAQLPYLNAVCQETLRIYPVGILTLTRIAKAPVELMGYKFAAGTIFAGCIYLTHHRPEIYPEPEQFKPERFLERQFSPSEFLPFGGGNRRCIGMAFALFEMKLVLATILSNINLALTDSRSIKPVRRGLTLAPPNTLQMKITSQR